MLNFSKAHLDWNTFLHEEQSKDYFKILKNTLEDEFDNHIILPEKDVILKVLELSPKNIKVVILGQDPYPTFGHANGLSFSVNNKVAPLPKSLSNIYKELKKEFPNFNPSNGNLEKWFEQGVFLLNTILTIRQGQPLSHKRIGWELFTINIIKYLQNQQKDIVYLLWGKNAHLYENYIDNSKNLIIKTSHPSPLGYTKSGIDFIPFKDSNQFRETNLYLSSNNKGEIHW
ncbi:MAG: uracil-DNA glycosylase [Crocinitomicaceae bacterium]|jgi:uracil-DNA glycosylase